MPGIDIRINEQSTRVHIAPGALASAGRVVGERIGAGVVLIVTDDHVGSLYGDAVLNSFAEVGITPCVHTVPAGERSKCVARAEDLYAAAARAGLARDGHVFALGGGVVSDLAGFVAATWMRGVGFAICPTTVEACIDASIGGKTAINIPAGKNLVGAFHQPHTVIIDPNCLSTLPARDVRAGLAESVKHALITSESMLAWHEDQLEAILACDPGVTTELIVRNVRIKADIVERDATERTGVRMLLNFGHTIGHAIESCSGYALRHGECVALGMLGVCRLSETLGLLDTSIVKRVSSLDTPPGPTEIATSDLRSLFVSTSIRTRSPSS